MDTSRYGYWFLKRAKEEISEFYRDEIIWDMKDGKNQVYICMYHKNVFEKMKVDEKEYSMILFNTLLNEN